MQAEANSAGAGSLSNTFSQNPLSQHHGQISQLQKGGNRKWQEFMKCSLTHPGVRIRLRLRAGVQPLMDRVAAQYHVEPEYRWCRICGTREIEDAAHFVSSCAFLEPERIECLLRLDALVANANAPILKEAMHRSDYSLFLGDSKLQELPSAMRTKADRIICNYLKVAWAKRQREWLQKWCLEGNAWLLR